MKQTKQNTEAAPVQVGGKAGTGKRVLWSEIDGSVVYDRIEEIAVRHYKALQTCTRGWLTREREREYLREVRDQFSMTPTYAEAEAVLSTMEDQLEYDKSYGDPQCSRI